MSETFDILCAADLCVDVILRGNVRPRFGQVEQFIEDYTFHLGGSATIFAAQASKLGAKVGIIGTVGPDLLGEFILDQLRRLNLDVSRIRIDPGLKTGAGFALVEETDRAILTYSGSIDAVGPADLGDDIPHLCRHWHIASYFLLNRLRPHWPQWLERLRASGVTISLDTNWDPQERWESVLQLLPLVDVFLPNEAEALAITGERDIAAAGRALAARGPLVAIKRDVRGAMAFHGERIVEAPVDPRWVSRPVVDTIGAGDCFDAGFISAWRKGWPLERCLLTGLQCGSASTTAAGGFDGQLREVRE